MTATGAEHALAHHLPLFPGRTVLVMGDVMLDRYVLGEVRRISPEAPIPVLRAQGARRVLGGAGNVAQNAAALGARAVLVGVIGDDAAGAEIGAVLGETPAVTDRLVRAPGRPTTVKTRFMSGAHQLLRLDEEVTTPIEPALEADILAAYAAALPGCDIVVLSDYAKGALTDAVLARAIALAHAAGRMVVIDPKRRHFGAYAAGCVLTPNAAEAARATGLSAGDDAGAAAAGMAALEQARADAVLVKRSEKGLTLVRRGVPPLHIPTRAQEVADVSGAGDTLVTAFAIALATGAPMHEAAGLGNAAAGIVVGKPGTASVTHTELYEALHRGELLAIDEKVADLDTALARIAAWRQAGLRIGFTNGCFDLIHPGHVRLLARARAACDRLVVGLNSDDSVRRLKGPERPVQNETARATVMASMASADLVVLFEEDTPGRLIEAIKPDLLFKGADYRLDQVVGADIVQAHGGRVELIPLEEGFSTTNTIRRINAGS
ncbi:D-glycero-beta-D-manno-heptose-7-phosphate kinase [Limobrevibacterium gyesilva]|uniref:Bifunctional protein HldE n=1 Tax=Limobrevibacterium gyesilva TaxID=2991712 RepID=A0AA42CJM4_9PROT|nr:D-glycero-beta-D-manno-heptose-7-phosphate kinase [Limobrevibacterium gyesilva]MCW3477047.1 D-glycero-beta-D-manno-heptose-7-phosphate kinase [Limobrevibacterium gyesilva]